MKTLTKGSLDMYCLECHRIVTWRKEHVVRDDGYYDWLIVAACGCGEIVDRDIIELAQAAYQHATADTIFNRQEEAMEKILGPDLHAAFNRINHGRGESVSGIGRGGEERQAGVLCLRDHVHPA